MTLKNTATLTADTNTALADNTTQQVSETEIREVDIDIIDSMINKSDNPIADIRSGRKNLLINGDFRIWQRGTSVSASGVYLADRWRATFGGGGSQSRQSFTNGQTDVPGEPEFYHRLVSSTGSGNNNLFQYIENVRTAAGQTITISFWAKANSNFTLDAPFIQQIFGSGGSTLVTIAFDSVDVTTSWQEFERQVVIPSINGKTIGPGNSLRIIIGRDDLAFTLDIAKFQIEIGNEKTDFEYRPIAEELALCKRYFERLVADDPGNFHHFGVGVAYTTAAGAIEIKYNEKRVVPSITPSGSFVLMTKTLSTNGATYNTTFSLGKKVSELSFDTSSGLVQGDATILKAADNQTAYIEIDAEL